MKESTKEKWNVFSRILFCGKKWWFWSHTVHVTWLWWKAVSSWKRLPSWKKFWTIYYEGFDNKWILNIENNDNVIVLLNDPQIWVYKANF